MTGTDPAWTLRAPCGCTRAVTCTALDDDEHAWEYLYGYGHPDITTRAAAARDRADGWTVHQTTVDESIKAYRRPCTHPYRRTR